MIQKRQIKKYLTKNRYEHTLRVTTESVKIARSHKLDSKEIKLIYTAAMLHDIAKNIPLKKSRNILKKAYLLDEYSICATNLYHSIHGKVIAQNIFKIKEKNILAAINNHTIGPINSNSIQLIIYIADYTEEGRRHLVQINNQKIKKIARYDLTKAAQMIAKETINKLKKNKIKPHPQTKKLALDK